MSPTCWRAGSAWSPTAGSGKATGSSQTGFPTIFKFIRNDHVKAILRDVSGAELHWVEGTHYTLTGAGLESGGTLTATAAPAVGETLAILLDVPFKQEKNFPLGAPFRPRRWRRWATCWTTA